MNGKNGVYNGKRDPNKESDYGWWYGDPNQNYRYDLPPPYVRYQNWNPYLWRRDQPPPFWMYGDDKKYHWEFKKEWEKWYKGESKKWWDKFVPKDFKGKVDDLVNEKLRTLTTDLNNKERTLQNQITDLRNRETKGDVKSQRYLEEIHRLKNKIKDQELAEDLRHNYVYQILFENWKKKHKASAPYNRRSLILPVLEPSDRTGKNEWLDLEEDHLVFPSSEDIDKMKLDIDFFDVDKFHKMNVKRITKLGKAENPADKRFKYDIDQLDDKLFGKLDDEREKNNDIHAFEINPMYSGKKNKSRKAIDSTEDTGDRFYYGKESSMNDKKVHASTLRSDGGYDTFSRASDGDFLTKSVRFDNKQTDNMSAMKRPDNRKYFYQSPFKTAAKMMQ